MKKVSVVIPAKDEEETIGPVLDDLQKTIAKLKKKRQYTFEVIVVADHCQDKTAAIAKKNSVLVISNRYPAGKGNALRYGFKKAKGDYLVMMDADYSHQPEDLPKFLEELDKGVGLVIGSRIFGGSDEYTRPRAFGNIFLTLAFGFLHGRYLSDALNGYKAFRRQIFTDFEYDSSDFEIEIELLANTLRKSLEIVEVSSHERERAGGKAKSKVLKHGWKFFSRIIKEWTKGRFNG
jgi:glycosyltransferase involved in cell wall biosynthesis